MSYVLASGPIIDLFITESPAPDIQVSILTLRRGAGAFPGIVTPSNENCGEKVLKHNHFGHIWVRLASRYQVTILNI